MTRLKIAVPDLISNSYFPAVAAVGLGKLKEQGFDASIELIFPVNKACYEALRDGTVDCVGSATLLALAAFPPRNGRASSFCVRRRTACTGFW